MADIKLNTDCCSIASLEKIKLLFQDNVEEYTLYKCSKCQVHWLYKEVEKQWVNNIQLQEHEYSAWYVRIAERDLQHVLNLEFGKILFNGNYLYISTEGNTPKFTTKEDK